MLFLLASHGDDADDADDAAADDEGCDRTRTTIESTRWFARASHQCARARTRRTRTVCVVDEDARARVHETIGARRARRR